MQPQVFNAAFIVLAFWWAVLGAFAVIKDSVDIKLALSSGIAILTLCGIGACLGITAVVSWVILDRRTRRSMLQGDNVRGLTCSIGEVPLNAKEPVRALGLPVFSGNPDVPPTFYPLWLEHYRLIKPAHVALVVAMLKVYEHNKQLPATHVKGGHGGRTLLQHSLLVAYQMQHIAMRWSYDGLRDKTGRKVLLKLRDDSYKFDPMDPLVLIVGLAHDIGKIEAFIFDGGEIVGSHHEHDLTGARMLARMPEMWGIPDDDRQALLLAIAHYHHPMELPLSPDRRAIDDRTIALMELLIKADFTASAIERKGVVPTQADYDNEMDSRQNTEITDELIWEAFMGIIQETGRINSPDLNYNVGTICQVKGQNSMRLVIHETSIRGALMRRLGMAESPKLGDGRYEITIKLLQLLDDRKFLVKSANGLTYNADSALWQIGWFGRKATRNKEAGERITGWEAAIIILPTICGYVEALPSYHWVGSVERGTMGKARAKKTEKPMDSELPAGMQAPVESEARRTEAAGDDKASVKEPQVDENDGFGPVEFGNTASAGPVYIATVKKRPSHTKMDLSVLDVAATLMQKPKPAAPEVKPPTSPPAMPQAIKVEQLSHFGKFIVSTAAQQPKKMSSDVSPYMLKSAVSTVIQAEAVNTSKTGSGRDVYLVPRMLLIKHVQSVDWSEASNAIVNLCKTSRGSGFETIESNGELYLLAEALMMKTFIERQSNNNL